MAKVFGVQLTKAELLARVGSIEPWRMSGG